MPTCFATALSLMPTARIKPGSEFQTIPKATRWKCSVSASALGFFAWTACVCYGPSDDPEIILSQCLTLEN
jgi:hypothetical protein